MFVVSAPPAPGAGLHVISLPVGATALREKVERLRTTIAPTTRAPQATLIAQASELYDLVVRPAEASVDASQRILISADGPLHSLPFAVLARGSGPKMSYLIQQKPLTVIPSMTVCEQLRAARKRSRGIRRPRLFRPHPRVRHRDGGRRDSVGHARSRLRPAARDAR